MQLINCLAVRIFSYVLD